MNSPSWTGLSPPRDKPVLIFSATKLLYLVMRLKMDGYLRNIRQLAVEFIF
jgi:hypothetical protein